MTKIIQSEEIEIGAKMLQDGQLVAFPTETVFGLGAIANNADAVKSVYSVKGRPSDNPLIVHIADPEDIFDYMIDDDSVRHHLIDDLTKAFWPGPLTLVVPVKPNTFPSVVTGGMDTVGIRLPDHATTRSLIRATGFPIVGPSANISGKPSPTQVAHVMHDFDGRICGVVNAEPTRIGVESTVLDLTDPRGLVILRPGYITKSMLGAVVKNMPIYMGGTIANNAEEAPKAPGMKYIHYSPDQPVLAVSSEKLAQVLSELADQSIKVGLATSVQNVEKYKTLVESVVSLGPTIETATQQLFAVLRTFDEHKNIQQIVVELYPDTEKNGAYRNRLIKASSTVVE